jgi:hypothetical protein
VDRQDALNKLSIMVNDVKSCAALAFLSASEAVFRNERSFPECVYFDAILYLINSQSSMNHHSSIHDGKQKTSLLWHDYEHSTLVIRDETSENSEANGARLAEVK